MAATGWLLISLGRQNLVVAVGVGDTYINDINNFKICKLICEGLIYVVRGCVILKEIATATQHSPIFNEICTAAAAAPPKQGKLLRSLSPWKIYTREEKRGNLWRNLLPHKLDSHGKFKILSKGEEMRRAP